MLYIALTNPEVFSILGEQLHLAAKHGDVKEVDKCWNDGDKIDAQDSSGCSALHFAAAYGNLPVVKFFISEGANIEIRDHEGLLVFHFALIFGHRHGRY